MVLGSFAETLLLIAKTPVLLVNPKTRIAKTFDRILFPTDFGATSADQLREVLDLADRFGAKVTLFHGIENGNEALLLSSTSGPLPIFPTRSVDHLDHAQKHAEAWVRIAGRRKIGMDFIIHERSKKPADEIIAIARETGARLIAMQTNTGALGAAILGSTTRHVIRKSTCPVWVLNPRVPRRSAPGRRPRPDPIPDRPESKSEIRF
jgi:nucleotide-binding universal stress UspA family protein